MKKHQSNINKLKIYLQKIKKQEKDELKKSISQDVELLNKTNLFL